MAKFTVLCRNYVDGDGVKYERGSVVESPHPLDKMFRGGFRRQDGATKVKAPVVEAVPSVPSETEPLKVAPKAVVKEVPPTRVREERPPALERGRKVTRSFPLAVDEDYHVFKRDGKYFVYDVDEMESPINSEGLQKDEVDACIRKARGG